MFLDGDWFRGEYRRGIIHARFDHEPDRREHVQHLGLRIDHNPRDHQMLRRVSFRHGPAPAEEELPVCLLVKACDISNKRN